MEGGQSQAGADEERLELVGHVHAAHHHAVHERDRAVRDLLRHAQRRRVVQHRRHQALALLQVRPWIGVQHLRISGRTPSDIQ